MLPCLLPFQDALELVLESLRHLDGIIQVLRVVAEWHDPPNVVVDVNDAGTKRWQRAAFLKVFTLPAGFQKAGRIPAAIPRLADHRRRMEVQGARIPSRRSTTAPRQLPFGKLGPSSAADSDGGKIESSVLRFSAEGLANRKEQ